MPPRTKRVTALAVVPTPAEPSQLFRDLDVVALAPHPLNVRTDVGDVTELAASIGEVGVLEPLLVVPHVGDVADWPDGATHLVVAGHRRLAAAQLAAVQTVPCIIRPDLAGDVEALLTMLGENLQRSDLTPIEEAAGYHQLELRGLGTAAIATRTGRSRSTVEHRLQLLDLPESARTKLTHREITLDQAQALVEFLGDKAALKRLEAAAGTSNWKWELQSLQQARERKKGAAAALARLQAAGVRVVPSRDVEDRWKYALAKVVRGSGHPPATEQEIADHAGCPGHAALAPTSGQVDWVCLQPELHTSARLPADEVDVPEELEGEERAEWIAARDAELQAQEEERAAARAEVEATREACQVASAVRSEWLRGLTMARTKLPAKHAGPIALHLAVTMVRVLLEPDVTDWLGWLGIDVEDLDDEDVDEEQLLREAVLARDPHRVLLAMLAVEEETQAARPHNWAAGRAAPELLPWLHLLVALGYHPSDWEADRMEAGKALATRACRVCGCTNARACRGGCSWVDVDLCSVCAVTRDHAPAAAAVETVDVVGGVL